METFLAEPVADPSLLPSPPLKTFLQNHWDQMSPLLLGYSGGPDSKALLYGLLEAGCKGHLHVAHVDHGWRKESGEEAASLRCEVAALSLPFHTVRLSIFETKNREAKAREARLSFFRSLFDRIPFQALLLAHQADDLAETVLKRLFEGANLSCLVGMEEISSLKGMAVWRPFLSTPKKELLHFLEVRRLQPLIDATNFDPVYLRTRLRQEIFPFLHRAFGKEIRSNLVCLSQRAQELKDYLDQRIAQRPIQRADWGICCFCGGLARLEMRHLLQKMGSEEGISLPRTILESLLAWLEKGGKRRTLFIQSRWVAVDRRSVFFFRIKEHIKAILSTATCSESTK